MHTKAPDKRPLLPDHDPFLNAVCSTIRAHAMIAPGDHVVAAVSGGADSVALLYALCALKDQLQARLTVAHLNHGLRGEDARREAVFVETLARDLGLPCVCEVRDVRAEKSLEGVCLQEAARSVRYRFFDDVLTRCSADRLALGHTMDDQAETVLMRLLRGTSTRGLGGIPPVRGTAIIRPLIHTRRSDIEQFLRRRGLSFVQDTSAREQHYLRNRIRHELMPLLSRQYNPRIVEALCTTAALARDDEALLQKAAAEAADGYTEESGGTLRLPVRLLSENPRAAGRIVRRAFERLHGSCRGLSSAHVRNVTALCGCEGSDAQVPLPGGIIVRREYDSLLMSTVCRPAEPFSLTVDRLPADIVIPPGDVRVTMCRVPDACMIGTCRQQAANTLHLAAESISMPLTIRSWRPGDRMRPLGFHAEKKIKALFAEKKVPVRLRARIPLIESGDMIACVGALRIAEHCRVTPGSSAVIAVTVTVDGLE